MKYRFPFLSNTRLFWRVAAVGLAVLPPLLLQAQPLGPATDTLLAVNMLQTADSLSDSGDELAALEHTRQALQIFEAVYGADHLRTARTRMRLAIQLDNLYQIDSAINLYDQCLPFFETTGNPDLISWCHYQLGLSYNGIGQYELAHQHLRTAIALVWPDSAAKASRLASYKIGEASVYSAEKNYPSALALCESARVVYEQKKQLFNQALAAYHLAEAYFGLQDFQRALEWYLNAYHLLKTQDRLGAVYSTDLLVSIGSFYERTGEPELGLPYMLQAQTACLEACGPDSIQYARFLYAFGLFYQGEAQYDTAAQCLEHSLAIEKREHPRPRERIFQIKSLEALGDTYLAWGWPRRARACYQEILDIAGQYMSPSFLNRYQFELTTKLADIQCQSGDWQGSQLLCDTALARCGFPEKPPGQIFPRDYFRELCRVSGRTFMEAYRQTANPTALDQAEYYFSLAAQTLFREAAELSSRSAKEILFDRDHRLLTQWLDARMLRYAATGLPEQAEAAFHIAGQSKALLLYEARLQHWAARYAGTPDSLLRDEWSRQGAQIVKLENELDSLGNTGKSLTDVAAMAVPEALIRQRNHADSLLRRLQQSCPQYFRLRYQMDTMSIDAWRQWLQPDQCLLLYSLSDSQAYAFVLTRDTLYARVLPLDFALNDSLWQYRESLTAYYTAAEPSDALYTQALERYTALSLFLYNRLVAPVAAWLTPRVMIIPEGQLCYLPFETLLTGPPSDAGNFRTYPFWLYEKAVSYCFSPDLLQEMNTTAVTTPPKAWLGIAPFPEAGDHRIAAREGSGQPVFAPLPYSQQEVESIRSIWGGDLWLGARAQQTAFQQQAKQYRVLHLATHGRADELRGDRSFVAFYGASTADVLPASRLFAYELPAEMIVLSACEAGSGKLHQGEGIIGLVRAFAWAGAKSIVASMWVADDESTSGLMLDFYRGLSQGQPKDVALQQAQRRICRGMPTKAHPFFWAGFRLYGCVAPLR